MHGLRFQNRVRGEHNWPQARPSEARVDHTSNIDWRDYHSKAESQGHPDGQDGTKHIRITDGKIRPIMTRASATLAVSNATNRQWTVSTGGTCIRTRALLAQSGSTPMP